jgi:hypothetical protein
MRFLIDAMLPPPIADRLESRGHDAVSPAGLGAQNLPDEVLIQIATAERRVIVTENAVDFARVDTCPVLFVRKSWWPSETLAARLADSLDRWASAHPDPGSWPHWLDAEYR